MRLTLSTKTLCFLHDNDRTSLSRRVWLVQNGVKIGILNEIGRPAKNLRLLFVTYTSIIRHKITQSGLVLLYANIASGDRDLSLSVCKAQVMNSG